MGGTGFIVRIVVTQAFPSVFLRFARGSHAFLRHKAYTVKPTAAAMAVSRPPRHVLFQSSHAVRQRTAAATAVPAGTRNVDGGAAARLRSAGRAAHVAA